MYVDAEVQTDLTTSDIDVMADGKEKLENNQEERDRNKPGPKRQVPLFAEFLLVLVRLRLGLLVGHLADIYSLSKGAVSKIFTTWITMLYHVFRHFDSVA